MIKKIMIILIILVIASKSIAGGLPTEFFGVKLGGVYSQDGLPVKQLVSGVRGVSGAGYSYYFEPKKEYSYFDYITTKTDQKDVYKTSFRLFAYLDVPEHIDTVEKFKKEEDNLKIIVNIIEWSKELISTKDAYLEASSLCSIFEADIGIKAETYGQLFKKHFCSINQGDKILEIQNYDSRLQVALSYDAETLEKNAQAEEHSFRKIRASEIKPY